MIAGVPETFAIESGLTEAYERLGFRGLGYFVIHVCSHRYGVFAPDATMLAVLLDRVARRIDNRGRHTAPFAAFDAAEVARSIIEALYTEEPERQKYLDMSPAELHRLVGTNDLMWAPNGDEAFDDGSWVLQFDVGDRVRLIAFKRDEGHPDPETLTDIWLPADHYYKILREWYENFEKEWASAPKVSDGNDDIPL